MTEQEHVLINRVNRYIDSHRLNTKLRARYVAYPRFYLYKYLKDNTSLTLAEIGEMFNRDHSTVHTGLGAYEALRNDYAFYYKCLHVKDEFPMNFTTTWNISVGSLTLPPKLYRRISYYKTSRGLTSYKETIEKLLMERV